MTSFSYALSFSLSFLSLRHIVTLATMDEILVRLELLGKEPRWREGGGHHDEPDEPDEPRSHGGLRDAGIMHASTTARKSRVRSYGNAPW